jgi:hypothetical protein
MANSTARNPRLIISRIIPMATGLTLLSVGAILVLVPLTYWWSLFILFPGLIFLGASVVLGVALGWRHPLPLALTGVGFVVATVGAMFLLGVDWGIWWPLMLIVPGAAHGLLGMIEVNSPAVRPWVRMHLWLGVDALLLGLVFLLNNFSRDAILTAWYPFHWWGIFILMPGLGAFYNAANAVRSGFDGRHLVVRSLAAFGLAACAVTLATFLNAGWALQVAAGLASAGILFLL